MNIIVYSKASCPNCVSAKMILQLCKLDFVEVDVELGARWQNLLNEFPDARQMPQIFIDDQRIGGVAGLKAALKQLGKML
ncbi:MAG: glutaredoxin family protein [Betaproteobacteria bacterium]